MAAPGTALPSSEARAYETGFLVQGSSHASILRTLNLASRPWGGLVLATQASSVEASPAGPRELPHVCHGFVFVVKGSKREAQPQKKILYMASPGALGCRGARGLTGTLDHRPSLPIKVVSLLRKISFSPGSPLVAPVSER